MLVSGRIPILVHQLNEISSSEVKPQASMDHEAGGLQSDMGIKRYLISYDRRNTKTRP